MHIHDNLWIALGTEFQAMREAASLGSSVRLLPAAGQIHQGPSRPMHLTAIEAFCETLDAAMESNTADTIFVIYTGSDDAEALLQACLQVGAYLMLRRDVDA